MRMIVVVIIYARSYFYEADRKPRLGFAGQPIFLVLVLWFVRSLAHENGSQRSAEPPIQGEIIVILVRHCLNGVYQGSGPAEGKEHLVRTTSFLKGSIRWPCSLLIGWAYNIHVKGPIRKEMHPVVYSMQLVTSSSSSTTVVE